MGFLTQRFDRRGKRGSFRDSPGRRRGISPPEVIVVVVIVVLAGLVILAALPRRREVARMAGCRRNLMQIGIALALYDRSEQRLPTVPRLGAEFVATGGPLKTLLESLSLPDFTGLNDLSRARPPERGQAPWCGRVAGFLCPTDRAATSHRAFPAPISYRATSGDDTEGSNGGFAPDRALRLTEIESGDGLGFTAAFSERLLGTRHLQVYSPANYFVTSGPIQHPDCPAVASPKWRDDAGSSWLEASWRSTLYSHAITPDARPSCIAEDGTTALIGASSSHAGGVNVLIFDGSVRTVSPTVSPPVWKALATIQSEPTADLSPPAP